MQHIEIYTKDYCPYCHPAKELLSIKGVSFVDHDVTRDSELETQMGQLAGCHTVPQIFIDNLHIGGCDGLFALGCNQLQQLPEDPARHPWAAFSFKPAMVVA